MKIPPCRKWGMYAAYSADLELMLSESTLGRGCAGLASLIGIRHGQSRTGLGNQAGGFRQTASGSGAAPTLVAAGSGRDRPEAGDAGRAMQPMARLYPVERQNTAQACHWRRV